MRIFRCVIATLLLGGFTLNAQLPQLGSFSDIPVEITADGETRFEGGVAVAEDNVQIHYGDISIYTDYAEYNPDSRDILLLGNVRIYTPQTLLTGQRALYNLETRQVRGLELRGDYHPMKFRALNLQAPSLSQFRLRDATFTTDDSSIPSWRVKSKSVRIYPDDRVIFSNSTLYVGSVPIFWFPYLFASLDETGFEILPGYDSRWGYYVLTGYSFPVNIPQAEVTATVRFDARTELGVAGGGEIDFKYGKDMRSTGRFLGYIADDTNPDNKVGGPGEPSESGDEYRYRISFQHRLFLTEDIYAVFDINKLSDRDMMEDYFPNEFRIDPTPDNFIALTKWNEGYTLNLITRWQINKFQEYTERLPELALDIKQQRIFGLPVYYDGQSSVGYLRRAFADTSLFPDYAATRFDTYHQLSIPFRLFQVLSIVPKAGIRGTYYSNSGPFLFEEEPIDPDNPDAGTRTLISRESNGSVFRPIFNAGIESSFKATRAYDRIQIRALGLDGVRHVIQPYTNFSFVHNAGTSAEDLYQFDRLIPSTQPPPLDFPQFTTIDSIDSWTIWRLGVRNRLQTRRNNGTFEWLSIDNFVDFNFQNPYSDTQVSNFFTTLRFYPVPWYSVRWDLQLPTQPEGFTRSDLNFGFMPWRDLFISVGHRYINGNEYFQDSSQITFYTYLRLNDNWGISFREQYEFESNDLINQQYLIHRDLSSWIASFGAQVRRNTGAGGSDYEYGVVFVLTLKDAPQVTLPFAFAQSTNPVGGD